MPVLHLYTPEEEAIASKACANKFRYITVFTTIITAPGKYRVPSRICRARVIWKWRTLVPENLWEENCARVICKWRADFLGKILFGIWRALQNFWNWPIFKILPDFQNFQNFCATVVFDDPPAMLLGSPSPPSPRRWTPSPRRSTPSPRRSTPSPRRSTP